MLDLISDAVAATTPVATQAPAANGSSASLLMMVLFVAVFYFLLIRPQSKRVKEHRNLLANLAVGDEIVTAGGLLGKITSIEDSFLLLEIAENTVVKLQKSSVTAAVPKGTLQATQ